jgi:hypothetical protein
MTGLALVFWVVPRGLRDRMFRSQRGGASIQALAVLPFENLSGDSSKGYFADGFTDELITDWQSKPRSGSSHVPRWSAIKHHERLFPKSHRN